MPWKKDNHFLQGEGIDRRIDPNNPEYPQGALWEMLNMVYERDSEEPEKMMGTERLGTTAMGGQVTGLFDYVEGTRLISCNTDGKIYEYAGTNWAQSTGGSGFSTTSTVRWSGSMFYGASTGANLLVLGNGVDAPQKYTSSAGVSALGGSPPSTGQFPVPFVGRLWMASGSTLHYSKTNDCEVWTTPGGNIQIDRGTGDITALAIFGGNLIIFKRKAIYRIYPTTTLDETVVYPVTGGTGTVSFGTVKEIVVGKGDRLLLAFLSDQGVQALVPNNNVQATSFSVANISGPVQAILDRRSDSHVATAWADFNRVRGEYYLQYGTTNNIPTEGIIANTARNNRGIRWTRHDMSQYTAGTIFRSSGQEIQVIGDTSGKVYQMHYGHDRDGTSYRGRIYTPAYAQGRYDQMKQYGRLFVDARSNGTYAVIVRLNMGRRGLPSPSGTAKSVTNYGVSDGWGVGQWGVATWGGSGITGQHIRPSKVSRGIYMRVMVETTGANQWFKVNGMTIEYEPTALSVSA